MEKLKFVSFSSNNFLSSSFIVCLCFERIVGFLIDSFYDFFALWKLYSLFLKSKSGSKINVTWLFIIKNYLLYFDNFIKNDFNTDCKVLYFSLKLSSLIISTSLIVLITFLNIALLSILSCLPSDLVLKYKINPFLFLLIFL